MRTIALDYETYYKKNVYSIADLGNWRYCHDDRFDPFILSVHDGEDGWVGHPDDFNWDAVRGTRIIAHNAGFDGAVTDRLIELGKAPAWVRSENEWQCTANMSSYLASVRSLKDAVKVLEKRDISKGVRDEMNGKNRDDLIKAGRLEAAQEYALHDSVECRNLWGKYSDRWPEFERRLSLLTMKQCSRGIRIDTALLNEYILKLEEVIFNLEQSLPWTERGAKPTSPIAINEQCRLVGIPAPPIKSHFDDGDERHEEWERTYGPRFPWVYGAGKHRSLGKLLSSLQTVRERLRPDDTIDFSLLYFGGHTGRWSGGGSGFNLQNLRKVPLFLKNGHLVEPPADAVGKMFKEWVAAETDYALDIRRLLIARPNKKFIMCDLSQIEPRVLAILSGNYEGLMKWLATGISVYEAFARAANLWNGGDLKRENPDLYQLIKIQVLGLGYGCGWEKFIAIAASYGVKLTEEQSKELVVGFRTDNPHIPRLWKTLDDAFRASVGSDFLMGLPSGRDMTFRDVRREIRSKKNKEGKYEKKFVYTAAVGTKRKEMYGGLLTENITQATARDVFGGHLLALEENIGDVIFHVHDEAIVEVDLDVTVKDVEATMSVRPDWMPEIVLGCEGDEGQCYKK